MRGYKSLGYIILLIYIILIAVPSIKADETDGGNQGGFSFRGKPKPEADLFLITEFGLAQRGKLLRFGVNHVTWEIGFMKNLNQKLAVGGTFYTSYDDTFDKAFLFGIKARLRIWLNNRFHFDVAPGILFAENKFMDPGPTNTRTYPGFIGHVGIGYGDWISLQLQREIFDDADIYAPDNNTYFGITIGSYPGAIVVPISFILVAMGRHFGD